MNQTIWQLKASQVAEIASAAMDRLLAKPA
jgi:hypothetical protein